MGRLTLVFLVTIAVNLVSSESEVSIVTKGEVPTSTKEEIKRVMEDDNLEDEYHLVFTRSKSQSKWGGGDYTLKAQKALLEAHNHRRKDVSPQSNDMSEMLWNSTLAVQAQTWSDGCFYEHPNKVQHTDYVGIGQNLYIRWNDEGGDDPPVVTDAVDLWYGEVKDYHYEQNSCNYGAVCGHFTQVVWAKTTNVGCGITFCPKARDSSSTYKNAWLVTCNYFPAGNMQGEPPYKEGHSCASCEQGYCRDGLCSKCKPGEKKCECNLECQNCGTLNTKKCKCVCQAGYYGPSCENRCEDTDERCGANPGWPARWCKEDKFSFVKEKCPAMCKQCKKGRGRPRC